MNDHQRAMARKAGKSCGYADGGSVLDGKGYAQGGKVEKTMHEFKTGTLHSGSKTGPLVTNPKQAVAIALNQARRAGEKV